MLPKIAMLLMSYHFGGFSVHPVYRDGQTKRASFEGYQRTMDVHQLVFGPWKHPLYHFLFHPSLPSLIVVVLRVPSKRVLRFPEHVLVVLYLFFVWPSLYPG
jgi:hypothetical protein